jgi:hypothetical protein
MNSAFFTFGLRISFFGLGDWCFVFLLEGYLLFFIRIGRRPDDDLLDELLEGTFSPSLENSIDYLEQN